MIKEAWVVMQFEFCHRNTLPRNFDCFSLVPARLTVTVGHGACTTVRMNLQFVTDEPGPM
jgi:hypothetical protein